MSADHELLVELIEVFTAIQATDLAIAHRADSDAATRVPVGFGRG